MYIRIIYLYIYIYCYIHIISKNLYGIIGINGKTGPKLKEVCQDNPV